MCSMNMMAPCEGARVSASGGFLQSAAQVFGNLGGGISFSVLFFLYLQPKVPGLQCACAAH